PAGGRRRRALVGAPGRAAHRRAGTAVPRPLADRGGGPRARDFPRGAEGPRDLQRAELHRSAEVLRAGAPGARSLPAVADGGARGSLRATGAEPPAPARQPAAERSRPPDLPTPAADPRATGVGPPHWPA